MNVHTDPHLYTEYMNLFQPARVSFVEPGYYRNLARKGVQFVRDGKPISTGELIAAIGEKMGWELAAHDEQLVDVILTLVHQGGFEGRDIDQLEKECA